MLLVLPINIFFGNLFLFGTRVLKVRDTTFVCNNNDKKVDRFLDIAMCCDSNALRTHHITLSITLKAFLH